MGENFVYFKVLNELKQERIRKEWSVYKLSQLSGVDQASLSRLEKIDREPKFETVIKIANALEIKLSDILRRLDH